DLFEARKENLGLQLDKLIAARIGDAELKSRYAAVRRHDGGPAENNFGGRPGESGKKQSGPQRQSQQADQRFQSNQPIGREADRDEVPVSDGREGLHAKEKRPQKAVAYSARRSVQGARAAEKKSDRESRVKDQIGNPYQSQKFPPRHR